MQYLKFQLIKKHTPPGPPGCLLPPASVQSHPSSHGLCFICFYEIKNWKAWIYLFICSRFCFSSKPPLMSFNKRLQWMWKTLWCCLVLLSTATSWMEFTAQCVGRTNIPFSSRDGQQPGWEHGRWDHPAKKKSEMLHVASDAPELQSLCKWAAAPCNGCCSSWEACVSQKLLIEGEM